MREINYVITLGRYVEIDLQSYFFIRVTFIFKFDLDL